jgi:hypothetical protein
MLVISCETDRTSERCSPMSFSIRSSSCDNSLIVERQRLHSLQRASKPNLVQCSKKGTRRLTSDMAHSPSLPCLVSPARVCWMSQRQENCVYRIASEAKRFSLQCGRCLLYSRGGTGFRRSVQGRWFLTGSILWRLRKEPACPVLVTCPTGEHCK